MIRLVKYKVRHLWEKEGIRNNLKIFKILIADSLLKTYSF